ncbi:MAG: hypothetical protein NZO16_07765 [Deltaproteobacteria bacterium]|nr:hypothetical protein [Deltaproteobacteria bacterium]
MRLLVVVWILFFTACASKEKTEIKILVPDNADYFIFVKNSLLNTDNQYNLVLSFDIDSRVFFASADKPFTEEGKIKLKNFLASTGYGVKLHIKQISPEVIALADTEYDHMPNFFSLSRFVTDFSADDLIAFYSQGEGKFRKNFTCSERKFPRTPLNISLHLPKIELSKISEVVPQNLQTLVELYKSLDVESIKLNFGVRSVSNEVYGASFTLPARIADLGRMYVPLLGGKLSFKDSFEVINFESFEFFGSRYNDLYTLATHRELLRNPEKVADSNLVINVDYELLEKAVNDLGSRYSFLADFRTSDKTEHSNPTKLKGLYLKIPVVLEDGQVKLALVKSDCQIRL